MVTLRDVQSPQGAAFLDEASPPIHFGDPAAEYHAATTAAAVCDFSNRAQIELSGADRAAFLHNFCTNDIKRLESGSGCEAFVTNVKGRILGHILVFAGPDSLWIDSVPGSAAFLIPHLDKHLITEDAQLHDRGADRGDLFVTGPGASEALDVVLHADAGALALYQHVATECDGVPIVVSRAAFSVQPGFLLSAPRPALPALWRAITDHGVRAAGEDVSEALRIEARFPHYGTDLTDDNIAQEAGRTQHAISFTKGCYLGQEPIARLDALGHVNRELRGLRLHDGPAPPAGSIVLDPAGGKPVGAITSSAVSHVDARPVALAMLRVQHAQPGAGVLVQTSGGTPVTATVF